MNIKNVLSGFIFLS